MRYPEGLDPETATAASEIAPAWIAMSAAYGVLVGVGFFVIGRRAGQSWLWLSGASLVVASVAYLGFQLLGKL